MRKKQNEMWGGDPCWEGKMKTKRERERRKKKQRPQAGSLSEKDLSLKSVIHSSRECVQLQGGPRRPRGVFTSSNSSVAHPSSHGGFCLSWRLSLVAALGKHSYSLRTALYLNSLQSTVVGTDWAHQWQNISEYCSLDMGLLWFVPKGSCTGSSVPSVAKLRCGT